MVWDLNSEDSDPNTSSYQLWNLGKFFTSSNLNFFIHRMEMRVPTSQVCYVNWINWYRLKKNFVSRKCIRQTSGIIISPFLLLSFASVPSASQSVSTMETLRRWWNFGSLVIYSRKLIFTCVIFQQLNTLKSFHKSGGKIPSVQPSKIKRMTHRSLASLET